MTRDEAVAFVEDCRRVHADWLAWQLRTPGWEQEMRPTDVGGPRHHEQLIAKYDALSEYLKTLGP